MKGSTQWDYFQEQSQTFIFLCEEHFRLRSLSKIHFGSDRKEYTGEFYKVSIRVGKIQDTDEKVARYVNGLRMEIQAEISLLSPKTIEEAYQMVLKAEKNS